MKKALQESEKKYRDVVERITNVGILVAQDGKLVFTNTAISDVLGYTKEELTSHPNPFDLIHPDDRTMVLERHMKRLKGEKAPETYPYRIITRDGSIKWVEVTGVRLDWIGKPATLNFFTDISERKRTEDALRESGEKYRRLVQQSKDAIFLVGLEDNTFFASPACHDIFGYDPDEFMEDRGLVAKILQPDSREQYNKFWQHYKTNGVFPEHLQEWAWIRKDGQTVYTENILTNIFNEQGMVIGFQTIARDITKRKLAEEALRESEERYELATNVARVGVWDWKVQTNEFYLDPNVKALLGYSDAEIPNNLEVWSTYVHPDDKQPVMEAFQNHIDGKIPEFVHEHRMLHKDGSIRWIMARGTAIRDAQGNPHRVVGTDTDITQRKVTEEALRESEGKFRNLAEQSPNMIFINKNGKVVYANRKCEEITGYKRDELHSDDFDFYILIAPECIKFIKKNFKKHMSGEEVQPYEYTLISKSGKRIEAIITTKLIDYEGEKAILGIVTDITERKHSEKVLQEKDKKLERQAKNLEEANVALKVLLEQREKEKIELKENILINIKKLIFPYIEKLQNKGQDDDSQVYVNIIKSNLEDLISPLASTLSSKYLAFTPTEIQVTDLIKQGKTSKEIAAMLNVSPQGVSFHRGNIRKKLGLLNKKINLKSYLHSFPPIERFVI